MFQKINEEQGQVGFVYAIIWRPITDAHNFQKQNRIDTDQPSETKHSRKVNQTMTVIAQVDNHNKQSILLIGATGRLGKELVTHLCSHHSMPHVHAFCRTRPNDDWTQECTSIQIGDARKTIDLARALNNTKASVVIVAIGGGDSVKKTNIRRANAEALVRAIDMMPNLSHNIQVVLVSSIGAGPSKIKIGMGIGRLLSYHLRHVLADHSGQEATFRNKERLAERTWIVRPTGLVNKKGSGTVVEFGDTDTCPSSQIARSDVASYVVNKLCNESAGLLNGTVNIDTAKKQ